MSSKSRKDLQEKLSYAAYFDDKGIIKLERNGPHPVENTPLYHVTYLLKQNVFNYSSVVQVMSFVDIKNGRVNGTRSHDNTVAVLTYLVIVSKMKWLKKDYPVLYKLVISAIKSFKSLPEHKHPRDILYIHYLKEGFWFWAFSLLIPKLIFTSFLGIFLFMAIDKYKNTKTQGKLVKTDTEILYWIRTKLPWRFFIIHATRPYTVPILMIKFGKDWFFGMMDHYYREKAHPNRRRQNEQR